MTYLSWGFRWAWSTFALLLAVLTTLAESLLRSSFTYLQLYHIEVRELMYLARIKRRAVWLSRLCRADLKESQYPGSLCKRPDSVFVWKRWSGLGSFTQTRPCWCERGDSCTRETFSIAGSDTDSLCHARLDAQELTVNSKYQVFDIERADADEARVSFYTGLHGHIVDTLADLACPHLMQKGSLVPFQQLMLTLMKLLTWV